MNIILRFIVTHCHYGAKLPKLSTLDTKSASHARKILNSIKGLEVGQASKLKRDDSQVKTTDSFAIKVDKKTAVSFFNKFDTERNTRDFNKKAETYAEAKRSLDITPEQFDGRGKLQYYNALKKFTFPYYKVQVQMILLDEDSKSVTTNSMMHSRLAKYTLEDAMKTLSSIASNDAIQESKPELFDLKSWEEKHLLQDNNDDNSSNNNQAVTLNGEEDEEFDLLEEDSTD